MVQAISTYKGFFLFNNLIVPVIIIKDFYICIIFRLYKY